MRFAIKKQYPAGHPGAGRDFWLLEDNEICQVWTERESAATFSKVEAQRLLAEAKRNRPDDPAEIVALD
jgi:hypothetical protein